MEMDFILHILSAAFFSLIITIILITTQCRYTFNEIRSAFVANVKQRNANNSISEDDGKQTKKKNSRKKSTQKKYHPEEGTYTIAFFHPYCSSGGGGERVLWKTVEALGEMKEDALLRSNARKGRRSKHDRVIDEEISANCRNMAVVIYTIDEPCESYEQDLMKHIQERFAITLSPELEIHYIHLHSHKHLLEKCKRFTLLAESWGTIRFAWIALNILPPDVFVDTTGCSFTFLVAKVLAGCRVGCYVHYPTISTDMLSLVWERRPSYNNDKQISTNSIITYIKLIYYSAFAMLYGLVGSLSDLTMVNSTWTKNHIQYLWRLAGKIHIVFPPVDTKSLNETPLAEKENLILSIGQFRPEKDHALQLNAFKVFLEKNDEEMRGNDVNLILIGSCRGDDDHERVDKLKKLSRELGIQDNVEFVLNQPYAALKDYLSRASVGIHTMWNEHFGIGVVEMMAAGLVTVAHDSGGPKSDIIERPWDLQDFEDCGGKRPTGCLAGSAEEYADAIFEVIKRGPQSKEVAAIRESGRAAAERFSDQVFMKSMKMTIMTSPLLKR